MLQKVISRSFCNYVSRKSAESTRTILRNSKPGIFKYKDPKAKLSLCVLDWSGTTVDAHVIAPAEAFVLAFEKERVPISMPESRKPMGLRKDLHIAKILEIPEVKERWTKAKGKAPTQQDVDRLFGHFVPLQLEVLEKYAGTMEGIPEAVKKIRDEFGVKIGVTTGFTRPMVDKILPIAASHGFKPDVNVAGDEIENNMGFRPAPFMVWRNMERAGVFDRRCVVKVDDTIGGVEEGLNAGVWSVGVSRYSNYTDIDTIEQWKKMSEKEFEGRVKKSEETLRKANPHYVIDTIIDLPDVMREINQRIQKGEMP